MGAVYGTPNNAQMIYEEVTRSASDLRGRLRELVQIGHRSARPEDVEAVRAALFAAHGYSRRG